MKTARRCPWQPLVALAIGLAKVASPAATPTPGAVATPAATAPWLTTRIGHSIGPPGGEIRDLVMAPGDPERLYAGTANGHIFVSDDGAARWRDAVVRLPTDAVINRVAVDPRAADIAYAAYWLPGGGGGLVKTGDGGLHWEALAIPNGPALRTVALAPSAPDTVYVAGEAGVWRSDDGGGNWVEASGDGKPVREVESLAIHPRIPHKVYVGTRRQAYRSGDAGANWDCIGRGMAIDRDVFAIAASSRDPDLLVAGTCGFLYVSNDGGDNWMVRKQGFGSDDRRVQAVLIAHPGAHEVWAGTRGGIYRSRDAVRSFALVHGGVAVSALAAHPERPSIFAATEEMGVLASRDGGPFQESNAGLEATRAVAFDTMPGDLRVLVVARGESLRTQSLQISNDAGRTWSRLGGDLRFEDVRLLRAIARPVPQLLVIDGRDRWSRLASGGWLERFEAPPGRVAAVAVAHDASVVLAATDVGLFMIPTADLAPERDSPGWRSIHEGPVRAIDVRDDCFVAIGAGTVIRGGVRSLLSGEPGEIVPTETVGDEVIAVALGPDTDATVYAITSSEILVSGDRGASWHEAPLPWPAHDFRALAIDPGHPDQVVALDAKGALFRGQNRGRHWRVLDGDPRLGLAQDLRMSVRAPGLALVATLGHGVRVVSLGALPAE